MKDACRQGVPCPNRVNDLDRKGRLGEERPAIPGQRTLSLEREDHIPGPTEPGQTAMTSLPLPCRPNTRAASSRPQMRISAPWIRGVSASFAFLAGHSPSR